MSNPESPTTTNTFQEVFDMVALDHIIKNEDYYKTLLASSSQEEEKYSPFELCRKYMSRAVGVKNSEEFRVEVSYSKRYGRGRQFAQGGLSLQSLPKAIRGSIAEQYYYDIDMVNAHPTIIKQICRERKLQTPFLNCYIDDRETIFHEILDSNPHLDKCQVKSAVLSIIYGGANGYKSITRKTEWLKAFNKEIQKILKKVPSWFPREYGEQSKIKTPTYFNLSGSTLSSVVCVIENDILEVMLDYLKKKRFVKKICVLCFDGIMIPKGVIDDTESLLRELEREIKQKTSRDISLKVKDMETLPWEIPSQHLPPVPDAPTGDCYRAQDYFWQDFVQDMSATHNSLSELKKAFRENINKVMMKVHCMDDMLVRKISPNLMFDFGNKYPKETFKYKVITPRTGKVSIHRVKFGQFVEMYGGLDYINNYNKLDFKPIGVFENNKSNINAIVPRGNFNSWTGFQAKLLPPEKVNTELITPILNHIKQVWCAGEEEIFNYIIGWFKTIFVSPRAKSKVAIVLKSTEKQIGKGMIINDFLIPFVFGEPYSMSVAGLDTVTCRFNDMLMNKMFINCDELSTLDGSYHQSFDILKKRITDPTVKIEIKGGKSFIYPDFSNYIMNTNHDFTIKVEQGDARYLILNCSPCYKGQFKYFSQLADTFTQETANHFLSWVCYRENTPEIRNIPMTRLKREMIIMGFQTPTRFLLEIQQGDYSSIQNHLDDDFAQVPPPVEDEQKEPRDRDSPFNEDNRWIQGTILYQYYVNWCERNHERCLSNHKFSKDIKDHIVRKRSNGSKYDLKSIKINL